MDVSLPILKNDEQNNKINPKKVKEERVAAGINNIENSHQKTSYSWFVKPKSILCKN